MLRRESQEKERKKEGRKGEKLLTDVKFHPVLTTVLFLPQG